MATAQALGGGLKALAILFAAALFALALPLRAATYFVVVSGLGGAPEYETQFEKWASELKTDLSTGVEAGQVETLSGSAATRERIRALFSTLRAKVSPDDSFALFLIGHGTFDGTDYKFNIVGPDMTAGELKSLLATIPARKQLVVNMTSCSGASLESLVHTGRIVITATKSGAEKNATIFPRYWIDALKDPAADRDKNGSVSVAEAFRYTQAKLSSYFEAEKLLATEHAVLSDTGSKEAVRDLKPENHQGLLAIGFPLTHSSAEPAALAANPAKQKLLSRKQDLEAKIDNLKYAKSAMPEGEYKNQMGSLLLELARTQAEIDQ